MAEKQLTAQEERAIEEFLAELKNREEPQVVSVPPNTAVKFLMARKFDVSRAIDLFQAYRNTRLKEGIYNINPDEEPLRSELLSGKFTVLPGRDANGAALALFTARLHRPDVTTHKAVLQAIIYQLDKAIERVETQRNGLIFIYDMINSTYGNFDYELCVKILNLLKVRTVKAHELVNHIPKESLPEHFGGTSKISHVAWIQACVNSRQGQENGDCMDHLFVICKPEQNPKSRPLPAGMELSIHMPEEGGMTVLGLVQHVKRMKKRGIFQEYEEIRKEPPVGSFDVSKKLYNQAKNRYSDVLCLDQSRVKLGLIGTDETTDYVNASFMDGYKRKNAYIATQGPLPKTFDDFWRMVWEHKVLIIVMTTRVIERGRIKCGQYWPLEVGRNEDSGHFSIRNIHIDLFQDFKLTHLDVYNKQTDESRSVAHYQYMSWPDFGVPKSASAMLDFRSQVKQHQTVAVQALGSEWTGHPAGPPIVIHCSAGIGRTGTFCTLDICLSRLENIGTVDVLRTVKKMRTQRAFSIQTWDQYYFCYMAIIEYAQRKGLLAPVEWSDTDFETDSE
ncbi:hypothetical protein FKM82_000918 [Ascaphus truei]